MRRSERGYAGLRSLLRAKREPEMVRAPVRGAERFFIKANGSLLMSKENQKTTSYFLSAGSDGLRYPASTSCLGRHSCPADRGPNSSSLFPPQAAVVAVALFSRFSDLLLRSWCYLSADGKVQRKPEIFGEAVKRRRAKRRLRDLRANARISSIFAWSLLLRNC